MSCKTVKQWKTGKWGKTEEDKIRQLNANCACGWSLESEEKVPCWQQWKVTNEGGWGLAGNMYHYLFPQLEGYMEVI